MDISQGDFRQQFAIAGRINLSHLDLEVSTSSDSVTQTWNITDVMDISDTEVKKPMQRVAPVLDPGDLECSICFRLFYQPTTTPCGHTYCR
jgi:hypothetical protein